MDNRPIIVKKIKRVHAGHHGGAWKVAYADFVTAMMALFMVLWLVAMMSAPAREAVSVYFRSFSLFEGSSTMAGGQKMTHMPGEVILLNKEAGGVQGGNKWQKRLEEAIKKELEEKLAMAKDQVFLVTMSGGVRIEIVERTGKAMFGMGEARLLPHGEKILEIISGELEKLNYPLVIEGHTDAHQYRRSSYTNWELSMDRANLVRKKLVENGISGDRMLKVIGYASTDPIVKDDPYSPMNRRVSIVVKEQKDSEVEIDSESLAPDADDEESDEGYDDEGYDDYDDFSKHSVPNGEGTTDQNRHMKRPRV